MNSVKAILIVLLNVVVRYGYGQQALDTCSPRPVEKKLDYTREELSQKKTAFYKNTQVSDYFFSYVHYSFAGDCNSEGLEVANHEWKSDTLRIYTFWCHAGDPSGWEWGARITEHKWDCKNSKLRPLSSKLYIEIQGLEGGMSLNKDERKDPQLLKARQEFIKNSSKTYHGHFVYGTDADNLIKRARTFLHPDLEAATKNWKQQYADSGFKWKK